MGDEDIPEFETLEAAQRRHREAWAGKEVWAITYEKGFFTVHFHTFNGSVHPPSPYATPQEAVARLAQLMGIEGPVEPQTWPERVQIGGGT